MRRAYFHHGGLQPLIGETIDAFFLETVRRFPDRDAIVSIHQQRRLTYAETDRFVDGVARGMLALGVVRGDRVGLWSTDNVEWVLLQLATARVGAVLVNINPAYRLQELEHALTLARVQHLFLMPRFRASQYVETVCELAPEVLEQDAHALRIPRLPSLRSIIVFDPSDHSLASRPHPGFLTWMEFVERGADVDETTLRSRQAALDPDDAINIQFTSGTTGFPKAVVLSHHNILNNGYFIGEAMRFTEQDRLCVPVPFHHCFGMVVANLACLTHGAAIVIPSPRFEAGATLAAIERERCTAVHGVPTMFLAELEQPNFDDYDLGSLRTGIMAGAPCPPSLLRDVRERMGCREILVAYGQTEASPVTHITLPDDPPHRRTETVGTSLPHQEVKIVDPETDATVPMGAPGEVCFRGYHVMRGYFDAPDATASAIDEAGWLHSGDLGVMEEDGYLRITGRLKDLIIRGGENIYPAEIESVLLEHPDVAQVAVFGLPDERMGEIVAAWIRPRDGAEPSVAALQAWIGDRLAHYKIPARLWFVDEFPMTATGKVQKFRIREIVDREWTDAMPPSLVTDEGVP